MKKSALILIFSWLFAVTAVAAPYEVQHEQTSYISENGGVVVPASLIRPKVLGEYPVVLYVHGRVGLSEPVIKQLKRIASRGMVIFAPDYFFARALPTFAERYDPDTFKDVDSAVSYLKSRRADLTALKSNTIGILSQDHGGYMAGLITAKRQDDIGAFMALYPLMSNPNSDKPVHLYQWMPEVDQFTAPTLIMIGEKDREMRRIQAKRVIGRLKILQRDVEHIEYASARRCFDWIEEGVRLPDKLPPADKLSQGDSINQIVKFAHKYLGGEKLLLLDVANGQLMPIQPADGS